ncbi:MAG: hypothetical protein ABJB86_14145 [Bacteroidota bacterium]
MKKIFVKYSILLLLSIAVTCTFAQQKTQRKKAYPTGYSSTSDEPGNNKETIRAVIDNIEYKMEMVNEKITALDVDGKQVPPDQYGQYETVIAKIKEQLRLDKIEAKKDQEQAMKDQKLAMVDQEKANEDQKQAMKDQVESKHMQERSMQDQRKAKLAQEQASKDQSQAKLDQEQAMKSRELSNIDQKKADEDQHQAKLNQERAAKDQMQAKLGQEKAIKDQALAKIDQKNAEEDQRQVKLLITDLTKDGVVADEKNLYSIIISDTDMTVNDKKQTNELYEKYKAKYPRFASGHFSYSNSQNGNTIHIHRE